jgi:hypothetical protein
MKPKTAPDRRLLEFTACQFGANLCISAENVRIDRTGSEMA